LGVVENEPVSELAVEEGKVGKEPHLLGVGEGSLEGSVEALGVGVPLWGFWGSSTSGRCRVVVQEACEFGFELAAVVEEPRSGWLAGSPDKPRSRARAVARACLEGRAWVKAQCETGSRKGTRTRQGPPRRRSRVSEASTSRAREP
jgi:hypothetical protein